METKDNRELKHLSGQVNLAGQKAFGGLASTPSLDRDGEVIAAEAWPAAIAGYLKNPVIMAAHHGSGPRGEPTVIGRATSVTSGPDGLRFQAEWADTPLAQEYRSLVSGGFLSGVSVGFIPRGWRDDRVPDGKGKARTVRTYTDVELVEISLCAIPSNRESLLSLRGKSAELAREIAGQLEGPPAKGEQSSAAGSHEERDIAAMIVRLQEAIRDLGDQIESLQSQLLDPSRSYARSLRAATGSGAGDRPDGAGDVVPPADLAELKQTIENVKKELEYGR